MKIICIGDVVGRSGRAALAKHLPLLRSEFSPDLVVVNGENAAGGLGLTAPTAHEIYGYGVDVITLGDHTWHHKDLLPILGKSEDPNFVGPHCIRPVNFAEAPGTGSCVIERAGHKVGVVNVMGRTFMGYPLDCPFRAIDRVLTERLSGCNVIVCDFHAEATSEKVAMGFHLDGRASILFGTHTHVQTSDERILPGGTAYITDLGMSGALDSVIGMDSQTALRRFLSGVPVGYRVAEGEGCVSGIVVEITEHNGRAVRIERFHRH